jgi:hypothetical protein
MGNPLLDEGPTLELPSCDADDSLANETDDSLQSTTAAQFLGLARGGRAVLRPRCFRATFIRPGRNSFAVVRTHCALAPH